MFFASSVNKYDGIYDTSAVGGNSQNGLKDAGWLKKTGYHLINGNNWRVSSNGTIVDAETSFNGFTGADIAKFLGVLDTFKYGDVTVDLIPEWSANTYTVKYDKNAPSGTTVSGTTADSTHTYDIDKALTTNGYSINNYKFLSWNTKKDGSGTSYTDGATVKNLTTENNGTVTLYAQWKQDIIYINKPTVSGSFTYNIASQTCSISGYDASKMAQSGITSATNAGIYTVTFTLKDGYAWADTKNKDAYSCNWSIAKRTIGIPYLSNTSQTFEDTNLNVGINNVDWSYVNQGGTTTAKNQGTYTVTWSLKDATNCTWADGSTESKSGNWSINWVNGTSHYSNDIYNRGWLAPGWEYPTTGGLKIYSDYLSDCGTSGGAPLVQKYLNTYQEIPNFAVEASKQQTKTYSNDEKFGFKAGWLTPLGASRHRGTNSVHGSDNIVTLYSGDIFTQNPAKIHGPGPYGWTINSTHRWDAYDVKVYRIYWTN